MPTLYIIAGPNGAGKTTASKALLTTVFETDVFINADMIAAQLNPENVEAVAMKAARMMLEQIQANLQEKKNFAIETTMASRSYLNLVKQAQLADYEVVLYFFYLPSADMAKQRVKLRVRQGGHYIPEDVIERRYHLGIQYFFEYIVLVDNWFLYKNDETPPQLIAEGEKSNIFKIQNGQLWNQLKER